jgi:hypothetical protein
MGDFPPEGNYGGGYHDEDYFEYTLPSEDELDDDIQSTIIAPSGGGGGGGENDMAAMIAAAAARRNQRIVRGSGERKMRAVKEAIPAPTRPPDKQDFASMAAAAAAQRKNRIEASGGTLQITHVRDIPKEHANVFVNIAEEAAKMGRLVRSNEHVVEAESKRVEEKDTWNGPGGLRNQESRRSMFERAISEAAAKGRMKMNKPNETTNYDKSTIMEEEEEDEIDIDKQVDEHGRRALRTHFLLDQHVREGYREKKSQWDLTESIDTHDYTSIDEVELPTEKLPSFKPKDLKYMSQREALEAISNAVAASAWERNFRLQRPKAQLRVTRGCKCPYCKNPNPFQTHKYKKMMAGDSSDDDNSFQHHAATHDTQPEEELQPVLPLPEGKIYQLADTLQEQVDEENCEEDTTQRPKGVWKPPLPPTKPQETQPQTPASIYVVQPSGSLRPIPHPEEQAGLEEPTGYFHSSYHTGTKVLLNETIDFGTRHKRVHIKREKRPKAKDKKQEKKKKSKEKEGCILM